VWVLITFEFHSAPQHVVCTLDTDSVPTHNVWVSQCPTARGVHIRNWQCSHTQCVSFTVPHSTWCGH